MSPRTAEQNEQIRSATRQRILDAALALFAEHGYERTSVRMIADQADVAQGLLYSHFEGKQGVLQAIFEESVADVRESFALADAAPPGERLERLIRGSFEVLKQNLPFWRLSYGVRMQPAVLGGLGPALHEWTTSIKHTLQGYLVDAGVPQPEVEAAVLFALIDGIAQHYVLDPQRYPLDAVTDMVVARFCGDRSAVASGSTRRDT